jgi:hypothetical protein
MSTIEINEKWNIVYDGVQYSPARYMESYPITVGVNKGKMSEAGWKLRQKYFPTITSCLSYIIEQDVFEKGDMSLSEFLVEYKASADELSELVKQAIKL